MKFIEVRTTEDGLFECVGEGQIGSPTVGRGVTILEAVGEWAIQTRVVVLNCEYLSTCDMQKYRLNFSTWDTRE